MVSDTCYLSSWMTVAALPSILFPWCCGEFFWVYRKQISEQLSYTELKTFGAGQEPIPEPRATSHILIFKQSKTGNRRKADYSTEIKTPESADLSCVLGLGPSSEDLNSSFARGQWEVGCFKILSHGAQLLPLRRERGRF